MHIITNSTVIFSTYFVNIHIRKKFIDFIILKLSFYADYLINFFEMH